jgi:NADH-quinone oxidoreductase subunit M
MFSFFLGFFLIFFFFSVACAMFFFSFNYMRTFGFFFFSFLLLLSLYCLFFFNKMLFCYQIIIKFFTLDFLNISYILGFDGISVLFLLLSCLLLWLCFLFYWFLRYRFFLYNFLLFFSLWILINIFLSLDFFIFFLFFEAIVLPMFLFIEFGEVVRDVFMLLTSFLFIHCLVLHLFFWAF